MFGRSDEPLVSARLGRGSRLSTDCVTRYPHVLGFQPQGTAVCRGSSTLL